MSKVNINYTLENKEKIHKEIKGILNNNHLIFNDDDININININIELLDSKIIMIRENREILNYMVFSNQSSCKYTLKKYNKTINFDIELLKLYIGEKEIEVIYKIEDEKFIFHLDYEVI